MCARISQIVGHTSWMLENSSPLRMSAFFFIGRTAARTFWWGTDPLQAISGPRPSHRSQWRGWWPRRPSCWPRGCGQTSGSPSTILHEQKQLKVCKRKRHISHLVTTFLMTQSWQSLWSSCLAATDGPNFPVSLRICTEQKCLKQEFAKILWIYLFQYIIEHTLLVCKHLENW